MKPLFILLQVFVISLIITALTKGGLNIILSGRIALSVMLLFTAIGHFKFTRGMEMMMPQIVPAKRFLVYFTGVLEFVAAVGLFTNYQWITGMCLLNFFVLVLPFNIYAAIHRVDYERATHEGKGPKYLWIRIPMQIFFIGWAYYFAVLHY
ncbi:putative membrane protein [Mucilaginibacter yixingensis]|uniref:Putative membrane protein n=1 Tax=Mucilaginibacter yixingensis TaxID=1295612 RepID=A0A2T5J6G2_9SPHI|nr:hypothetical protein [Mucilaginibacter yixingensis]PTQ94132.1 putative membrane protein [Mucilaginibacter yixingensis]